MSNQFLLKGLSAKYLTQFFMSRLVLHRTDGGNQSKRQVESKMAFPAFIHV